MSERVRHHLIPARRVGQWVSEWEKRIAYRMFPPPLRSGVPSRLPCSVIGARSGTQAGRLRHYTGGRPPCCVIRAR